MVACHDSIAGFQTITMSACWDFGVIRLSGVLLDKYQAIEKTNANKLGERFYLLSFA